MKIFQDEIQQKESCAEYKAENTVTQIVRVMVFFKLSDIYGLRYLYSCNVRVFCLIYLFGFYFGKNDINVFYHCHDPPKDKYVYKV